MEQAEKLAALLQKLKANKEKVPLEVLKTKYKAPYEALLEEIHSVGVEYLKAVASKLPDWCEGLKVGKQYGVEMTGLFNDLYKDGGYSEKIGRALYKNYSLPEAEALAAEINKKYHAALLDYFHSKTCLYATAESFNPEDTKEPKIYNALIRKFWDEATGGWVDPTEEDNVNAILIFIGKENKQDEQRNNPGTEPGTGGHSRESENSTAAVGEGERTTEGGAKDRQERQRHA